MATRRTWRRRRARGWGRGPEHAARPPAARPPFAGVAAEEADAEAQAAAREEATTAQKGNGNRAFQEGRVRAQRA
jgi:hypothetical protein